MCLDLAWTEEKSKKWANKQCESITAYKVAVIGRESKDAPYELFPPYYKQYGPYRKENRIEETRSFSRSSLKKKWSLWGSGHYYPEDKVDYVSYYYLFLRKKDAERYSEDLGWKVGMTHEKIVMKCTIPRELVTMVGTQIAGAGHCFVIVTRGFDIIGEDKYMEEEVESCV